jgi:hypothetical protein
LTCPDSKRIPPADGISQIESSMAPGPDPLDVIT